MNKWLEILFGLLLVLVAIFVAVQYSSWGIAVLSFIKGGIVLGIALVGLILLVLGISDLKN
ncbi:hypothetical protein KA107_02510 [Candidatus Pacearchaeota archaeon]|nr:hypothetical protein [Candidatus Pacearchaeota archaeon]